MQKQQPISLNLTLSELTSELYKLYNETSKKSEFVKAAIEKFPTFKDAPTIMTLVWYSFDAVWDDIATVSEDEDDTESKQDIK